MTDEPLDALFDDELKDLIIGIRVLFDEDEVIAAIDRATALIGAPGGETSVEDVPKLREVIKAELRRLVTPQ